MARHHANHHGDITGVDLLRRGRLNESSDGQGRWAISLTIGEDTAVVPTPARQLSSAPQRRRSLIPWLVIFEGHMALGDVTMEGGVVADEEQQC